MIHPRILLLAAACSAPLSSLRAADPALTIYNDGFAVVRETIPLDLQAGVSTSSFAGVTTQVEPDSVVLRDPTGRVPFRVLEQSYRADTASQALLLDLFEGRELDFLVRADSGQEYTIRGRVVRSGYAPGGDARSPIIEVDGQLRFSLPGEPLFPDLGDDAILQPMLSWQLASEAAQQLSAELSYLTGGLSWEASYNFVLPEKGDRMDAVGWVTVRNRSGTTFEQANVKLMAGEVNRVQDERAQMAKMEMARMAMADTSEPVTQKEFDAFRLYSLPRPVTLRDQETKQVEFLRAAEVQVTTLYVYDGAAMGQYRGWNPEMIRQDPDYGTQSNREVWVMHEFANTEANNLGVPLPAGLTRFYRRDAEDGRLEFTGENTIEHTPPGETVRVYTGNAFDLVGERQRTDFAATPRQNVVEEEFEITLRNRQSEPAEIRVVEHLYRGANWEIVRHSQPFEKIDAQTIEFHVPLAPDEEKTITYRVRYQW